MQTSPNTASLQAGITGKMKISILFTLLLLWKKQDFVSCVDMKTLITVALGDSLTLNCTYNCTVGFVRGCWSKATDNSGCLGIYISPCTVSLHLPNVSTKDLNKNYTCYTQDTADPDLPQRIEKIVLLQLQAQESFPTWTETTPITGTKNAFPPTKPNNSTEGEFPGIRVLARVTVVVATLLAVLALYLCLKQKRKCRNNKGEPVVTRSGSPAPCQAAPSPVKGSAATQSERVTLRMPAPDNDSDTEVPYADIMITVRGVSNPELTQVGYLTPGDPKEWWGDEPRCHLQASRSADRLHVPQPREVSRKMSTNSEYAVITYA